MVKKRRSENQKSEIRNSKSLVGVIMGSKSDWETSNAGTRFRIRQYGRIAGT